MIVFNLRWDISEGFFFKPCVLADERDIPMYLPTPPFPPPCHRASQGKGGKMSASAEQSAIYVTDTGKKIKTKISRAFSGGQETAELQKELGADLEVDVAYQYLTFFSEDDDELETIGKEYKAGRMMTGQVKGRLIELLTAMVKEHQDRRATVGDEILREFMRVRELEF